MMLIETDILVIGAGPAGSTAAKHAAEGGARVLLMDKKSEIGAPKRCALGDTLTSFRTSSVVLTFSNSISWKASAIEPMYGSLLIK